MQTVTSKAVYEITKVSDIITLKDDSDCCVRMRICGKVAIITVYAKRAINPAISIYTSPYTFQLIDNALKTALVWGGVCYGEAYIETNSGGLLTILASSQSSGEIVAFLE